MAVVHERDNIMCSNGRTKPTLLHFNVIAAIRAETFMKGNVLAWW